MAAYAALVSLRHIIEQMQHHPRPPISLDNKQVESLTEKVTFLQDFLEGYSINGGSKDDDDGLESRIAEAAYAAEDIIESHIVDQILSQSTSQRKKIGFISFFRGLWTAIRHGENMDLYQGLQKVIQEMDFIKKDVMLITEKMGSQDQLLHRSSISAGALRPHSTGQNMTMVGFDDVLIEIMDKLTGQQSNRQIIPIVGMGGIGKTTLAKNIYANPLIKHHFDILVWATISQAYNAKEILLEALLCLKTIGSRESLSQMSEDELGEILYKSLSGRRYLIVMDDIWSIEAWDKVKLFFPDNNNGSRMMITTRLSNLAFKLTGSYGLKMNFLDEDKSWNLLCNNVFGEEGCPIDLEDIGKKIAKNCKGLPLSIVVIGGLLAKSQKTQEHWEYIAENLTSIVNLDDNERCLKILHMSYNQLPVHLKPCFLYMGVFPEDCEIYVSNLMKLWVAEGFLKPISGKSLEVVAEEYFKDLIDRNLILVHKLGSAGNIKVCTIHDLLRDLCIKEAEKDKFFRVAEIHSVNIPQDMHIQRRIAIRQSTSKEEYFPQVLDVVQSASLARSLICNIKGIVPSLPFKLLRVLNTVDKFGYLEIRRLGAYSLEDIFQLVNSRHLAIKANVPNSVIPSSVYRLWNLQTLVVNNLKEDAVTVPSEIWKMPQLRHVEFFLLELPDPPSGDVMDGGDDFVLGNLQTLLVVRKFKCGEEVVKRIPNIKKLQIQYGHHKELSPYCLNNLCRLRKLESLACFFHELHMPSRNELLQNLNFPHSLKKLTLRRTRLHWEDITTKIGSLPHLQVLKLKRWSFVGPEWETVEGQFCSLKFLLIEACYDLEHWRTDNTHFPRLEHLILRYLDKLKIPLCIGEIPTLKSIELEDCNDSAIISVTEILKEQEDFGNVGLQVRVVLSEMNQVVLEESLASPNFQVV